MNLAPVALRWAASRSRRKVQPGFSLLGKLAPSFAAGLGFLVKRLRNRSGSANLAQRQDLDHKVAAIVPDREQIAHANLARRSRRLMVGLDPAQLARLRRQRARLEETRGPQPFIKTGAVHEPIFAPPGEQKTAGEQLAKHTANFTLWQGLRSQILRGRTILNNH